MNAVTRYAQTSIALEQGTASFQSLAAINELHLKYKNLNEGTVANYIPELGKADPNHFGICIVTVDGQVFEVGETSAEFTVQSISKPFVYGMVLEDKGREAVFDRVGVEPTGDAFNSIIKLDSANRPHNPCVNAGAIAVTDLIEGNDSTEKLNRLLDMYRRYTARDVHIDMPVYLSERTNGHRNRAIAHLMLNFGLVNPDIERTLDLYFQQCSLLISCRDLAVMGATLANGGKNPITGVRAIDAEYIRDLLTVMYTCGMYDYAGQWAYEVGLPAKSGVCGGIVAIVPDQLAIATYSPPLDEHGNSVRGMKVCQDLSQRFGMHLFDPYLRPPTGRLVGEASSSTNYVSKKQFSER